MPAAETGCHRAQAAETPCQGRNLRFGIHPRNEKLSAETRPCQEERQLFHFLGGSLVLAEVERSRLGFLQELPGSGISGEVRMG